MPETPDDQPEFDLLDDYLQQLQAGQQPDREALLSEHPGLASALECLEALENMAPPSAEMAAADAARAHQAIASQDSAEAETPLVHVPRDFGSYELLEEIGRGGMGVVYKARQKGLDRVVAVKMILASFLASPEHVRRFQVEAKAAAGLRHPNIVHIHDVGQFHGQHYFTMEYVEGQSLAERIARGPLEPDAAARLLETVARAVGHLHQHGIVHRDLKPSNILLDVEGLPYVTDFGLAKVFQPGSEMTATGVIAGTPSYMSPEQATGHGGQIGPGSDVYSLGAVLYELLTGQPPFREENPLDTLVQVLDVEPTLPRQLNPRIPRALELICLKCLAKSADDRYQTALELAKDLERFLKGEEIVAQAPNVWQRLWAWARREPALASRLAALGTFYAVTVANYASGRVVFDFWEKITVLVLIWALSSAVCQQLLKTSRWSIPARFLWGTLDSAILLGVLLVADGVVSPLIVGYPLLIVGSGLWFRVRFVWYMTFLSLVSYAVLVADFYYRRPELGQSFEVYFDRHVIFIIALIVIAGAVSYLVQRVRALSSYYGQKV